MKITRLFLAIAIIAIAFASCSKSSDGLTNVIPANASYVASVDVKSLVEKSNYDIFQNETVLRGINLGKGLLGKKEAVDLLEAFTKDVNSLGLNLKGDCYVYTDYTYYGVVLGVNDAEKIKNALINLSLTDADGIKTENGTSVFAPTDVFVAAWTSDKFLLLGQVNPYAHRYDETKEAVDLKALAVKQLAQDEKESINSNPGFVKFLEEKKDISFFYTYSAENFKALGQLYGGVELPKEIISIIDDLNGATVASHISFDKGEIKTTAKVYYATSDAEKKYKELAEQLVGELKGEQLKSVPVNAIFAVSTNIKGTGMYNYLGKLNLLPRIKEYDTEDFLNTVLNEVDGDVTFAINNIVSVKKSHSYSDGETYEYNDTKPEYTVQIDCKDGKKALDFVKTTFPFPTDALKEIDAKTYSLSVSGSEYYFGVQGNTVFLTNSKLGLDNIKAKKDNSNKLAKLAKGNVLVVGGDIKPLEKIALNEISDKKGSVIVSDLINLFDTYNVTSNNESSQGKIEMTDKSQNSLASIFQFIDRTLTSLNSELPF